MDLEIRKNTQLKRRDHFLEAHSQVITRRRPEFPVHCWGLVTWGNVMFLWPRAGNMQHTHTHTQTHTLTHTHTHTHTYTHSNTHTHALKHTHTHIHSHTLTHIHIHTQTHSHTLTYTQTHTLSNTHSHTYTHTHTLTLTRTAVTPEVGKEGPTVLAPPRLGGSPCRLVAPHWAQGRLTVVTTSTVPSEDEQGDQ